MNAEKTPVSGSAPRSADALFEAVYERLKTMARRRIPAGQRSPTLETTALVHELYLRIGKHGELAFEHDAQFFAYAARAMRHLLSDRAREYLSRRAGGDWVRVTLTASDENLALDSAEQALALDAALDRLEAADPRSARVIELRYFAGLTSEQAADTLGISRRTADRDWDFAHAFLKTDLG